MNDIKFYNAKELALKIRNHSSKRNEIIKAKKYYLNQNDILDTGVLPADGDNDGLRSADNRISHNFHQLIVDEKSAYMFTYPIQFDADGNTELNKTIDEVLGEDQESIAQELCVEASNAGVAYLHYWIDDDNKKFEYATVNAEEIIAEHDKTLKKNINNIFRYYNNFENEKNYVLVEHWSDKYMVKYTLEGNMDSEDLKLMNEEIIEHPFETIPFIEFKNNQNSISDLNKYKTLIDLADKVISGYANDIEDIQQLIYILEGYGGEDLQEFKSDLKRFKAIKTDGGSEGGSVKTLQIEIPVTARVSLIEILEKRIYEAGQALQQDTESAGNASGVALKFFYRKLELKAGKTETQFKKGFSILIRAMLRFLNKDAKKITQTFTRNMISNDLEAAQIAVTSNGIISEKTVIKNHPWTEDTETELSQVQKERKESFTLDEGSIPGAVDNEE